MANKTEITERDIEIVRLLLAPFDPMAGDLYAFLFIERNEVSSEVRLSLKHLATKLHVRETNVTRAKRTLRALDLIREESRGRYGRTTFTVRPYCASTLRYLFEATNYEFPVVLKAVYRHLKVCQPYINDEFKMYPQAWYSRGRKISKRLPKAPVRWKETKELDLTPDVVAVTLPRYLPKQPGNHSERPVNHGQPPAGCNQGRTDTAQAEVTRTPKNHLEPIDSKGSYESTSEIPVLVNTVVFNNERISKRNRDQIIGLYRSYINFIEVTRTGLSDTKGSPSSAGVIIPSSSDLQGWLSTEGLNSAIKMVFLPAVKTAFIDDDSELVYFEGHWHDYDAPYSSPEAAGEAEPFTVVVGGDEFAIRAGNRRKLHHLSTNWKSMSAYEATFMVWETWNDATESIKSVYRMEIPQKVRDGQGHRNPDFMRAFDWVTSNFSKWGELWLRVLAGVETNAMLRGYGPSQLNIKSRPSFSWLFSNPDSGQSEIRIDRYLRGDFRWSTLNSNGTAKYSWLDWHSMEDQDRSEAYLDPDYGDINL